MMSSPVTFLIPLVLVSNLILFLGISQRRTMNKIDSETCDETDNENILAPASKISKDDFKIIKVIGRGSFGKVFMVKKRDTGMPYAMKVLKKAQIA
jgi:serine/threonine protein kinase